jgi:hypothetical protein
MLQIWVGGWVGGWGGKLSFQCLRPSASLRAAGKKLLEMIIWITFALILFVSCILGVLGEFLNILLTF